MAGTNICPSLNKKIFDTELCGISEAFKIAEQKTRRIRHL